MKLPKGSILTMDRGYVDYAWFQDLTDQGVFFVTRAKRNMSYKVVKRYKVRKRSGITSDQMIVLTSSKGQNCKGELRRVVYKDPKIGNKYYYLTNHTKLSASTMAEIYKQRWQIELFFKWIKQHLKIKSFIGTIKNAVLTKAALCTYLLIYYLKWTNSLRQSALQIIQLLQLNWFERRNIIELYKPPDKTIGGSVNLEIEFC